MHIAADSAIPHLESNLKRVLSEQEFSLSYFKNSEFRTLNQEDIDILLIRSTTKINESTLKSNSIKFIGSATSGIDHIDTKFLERQGIKWAHAPGCNAWSVVHYVMSALEIVYTQGLATVSNGIGIVGYGNIETKLESILKSLSIPYTLYDPIALPSSTESLEDVFDHDVVSLHVPLTKTGDFPTYHMIDSKELKQLEFKTLINTSRGEVINENILDDFTSMNLITDVWEKEPIIEEKFFEKALVYTPHIAGYSLDGKRNGTKIISEALAEFLGKPIADEIVNLPERKFGKEEFLGFQEQYHSCSFPIGLFSADLDLIKLMDLFKKDAEAGLNLSSIRAKHPPRRDFIHYSLLGEKLEDLEILSRLMQID